MQKRAAMENEARNTDQKERRISMMKKIALIISLISMLLLSISNICRATGLMTPKNGDYPRLAMEEHHVNITINNGYAVTEVDQVFHNPNDVDLEAIYSFPLPKDASLSELSLWIDGQEVTGEVVEKEKARKIYEEEKKAGRDTALAEKDDYRTFDVYVYPVRANDRTRVRLLYYQPVKLDTGIGRYVYPLEEGGVDEIREAFWTSNPKVESAFSLNLTLKSAYPLDDVRVPGHETDAVVTMVEEGVYTVALEKQEGYELVRDFVLYYKLADDSPARIELIPYKEETGKPGTFLLLVTPGVDLRPITEGSDWVFVLDRSGSMSGKINTLAEGVTKAIQRMNPEDRFRIVTFDNKASNLTKGYIPATAENVERITEKLTRLNTGNSTNLYEGIKLGLKGLDSDRTTTFILVTDGVTNTGRIKHRDFVELLKGHDLRCFIYVMGNSANWPLMERIADETNGIATAVSNDDDIIGRILLAKSKITHEAMHSASFEIDGVRTYDVTPKEIGNLYRGEQLALFGHYAHGGSARVTFTAKISGDEKTYVTDIEFPDVDTDNPEIERLWAYATIEDIMQTIRYEGKSKELRSAVVDMGTQYSLVTDYTSMIVVMPERFEELGIARNNKDRISRERAAREERSSSGPRNYRVDRSRPMFNRSAPRIGGGALDPLTALYSVLIGSSALLAARNRKRRG